MTDFRLVKRRYTEMMAATSWNELRGATVLYCEAMDQFYNTHGVQFADASLIYDNRKKVGRAS